MPFTWSRYGGYECSTKGDRRFSAFTATLSDGRTIEEHYQCDVKGYDPGGRNWRLGKGKPPLNRSTALWERYLALWAAWADANPQLLAELKSNVEAAGGIVSDRFAVTPINQARALSVILNWLEEEQE